MKRYLFFLLLGLAVALLLNERNHAILFPAALIALWLINRSGFAILLRWKMWLFLALLIAIPVLLVGSKNASVWGIGYNRGMLLLNTLMVERSLVILLTVRAFTNHLSAEDIARGLNRLRLYQFNHVLQLSLAMMPEVRTMVTDSMRRTSWRQILRQRSALMPAISRLMANIIFRAGKMATAVPKEENP